MASSIIGDAKYQELNMSFSFDEHQESKLIVKALVDHTPYELQLQFGQSMDFQDLKNALLNKQFKLVSKTPEILKLKVSFIFLEFKNVEKITLNTLKQTIFDLSNKLKEQQLKNTVLETTVNKMKVEFDLITTKIADLARFNHERHQQNQKINQEQSKLMKHYNESKEENVKIIRQHQKLTKDYAESQNNSIEVKKEMETMIQKHNAQAIQITSFEAKIKEYQNVVQSLRQQFSGQKSKGQADQKRLKGNEEKIEEQRKIIEKLQRRISELEGAEKKTNEKLEKMNASLSQIRKEIGENEAIQNDVEQRLSKQEELKPGQQEKIQRPKKPATSTQQSPSSPQQSTELIMKQSIHKQTQKPIQKFNKIELEQIRKAPIGPIKTNFIFSQQHKGNKIKLTNNNSTATNPEQNYSSELALVEGDVFKKGSSIRFKIQSIGWNVYVGLGIRNVIAANSYQLKNCDKIGHGCFLLSCGGWSFSHSNKEHNNVNTGFKYGKGDVIEVETNEDELWFRNERWKKEFKMKIRLTEEEWQQACFCVLLGCRGDSVSIQ